MMFTGIVRYKDESQGHFTMTGEKLLEMMTKENYDNIMVWKVQE